MITYLLVKKYASTKHYFILANSEQEAKDIAAIAFKIRNFESYIIYDVRHYTARMLTPHVTISTKYFRHYKKAGYFNTKSVTMEEVKKGKWWFPFIECSVRGYYINQSVDIDT